jgi:hypothetical protein
MPNGVPIAMPECMQSGSCAICEQLMQNMRESLARHMQAVARLQDAAIHNDPGMRAAMDAVRREASDSREEAFRAFAEHLLTHSRKANAAT